MAQIFMSYNKRDRGLAERVADALQRCGLTVWWDDHVTPREQWDRTLEREIKAAGKVLVLWTRNSVESDWVRIEANFARNCRPSKLVQARFDHSTIPIAFSLIQYVDLDWTSFESGDAWKKLLSWLDGDLPQAAAEPQGGSGSDDPPKAEVAPRATDAVAQAAQTPPRKRLWPRIVVATLGMAALFLVVAAVSNWIGAVRLEQRKAAYRTEFFGKLDEERAGYNVPTETKQEVEGLLRRAYSLAEVQDRYSGPLEARRAELELYGEMRVFRVWLFESRRDGLCYEGVGIGVTPGWRARRANPQAAEQREVYYRGQLCLDR